MGMGAPTAMITAIPTMSTELSPIQLLTLTQWLSPAFPIGAFSYSHGLEAALEANHNLDVEGWLAALLQHGSGRNDALLLQAAYRGDIEEADSLCRSLAPSQERLQETVQQGAAFCKTLRDAFGISLPDLTYPVAIGAAAYARDLPLQPVTLAYLHAFTANLVSCAQRLSALGQTEAQAMIARLNQICAEIADLTSPLTLDHLGSITWAADVASMQHEQLSTRIFQT